jgi:DNA-binding MarR family transcriptional regulator
MEDAIRERRRLRTALLVGLYHEVDGSVTQFVHAFELAAALGLERAEAEKAIAYLEERGHVKVDDHRSGVLRLTAAGVDEAEARILQGEASG